jgi:hypothetical protein
MDTSEYSVPNYSFAIENSNHEHSKVNQSTTIKHMIQSIHNIIMCVYIITGYVLRVLDTWDAYAHRCLCYMQVLARAELNFSIIMSAFSRTTIYLFTDAFDNENTNIPFVRFTCANIFVIGNREVSYV